MIELRRSPKMIVHQKYPLNAGPSLDLLCQTFVTPQEYFFVRTHGTIPEVDSEQYRLSVSGMVGRPLRLSLHELRTAFPATFVMAALQCAGNRRDELSAVRPIRGETPWGGEATSNALWCGVPLKRLLEAAEVKAGAGHVAFLGLDDVCKHGERFGFGGSIPLEKALSEEVLLAFEMNGEPLTPVHGFPLRVVVPGYIGARSVKWLTEITVQDQPSENHFQAREYRLYPPSVEAATAQWSEGRMLGQIPLTALICTPQDGDVVPAGSTRIRGYALTGTGREIDCIELSHDGGTTWERAKIVQGQAPWSWYLWEAERKLSPGFHQLVVRAWDSPEHCQPEELHQVWNFKGYMNNAWHRVNVTVQR